MITIHRIFKGLKLQRIEVVYPVSETAMDIHSYMEKWFEKMGVLVIRSTFWPSKRIGFEGEEKILCGYFLYLGTDDLDSIARNKIYEMYRKKYWK